MMKNIAAIIPAYNPQQSLITYVHQLLATTISRVIIVNDGSDQKYADVFEELKNIAVERWYSKINHTDSFSCR